jgi:hypothetical protein
MGGSPGDGLHSIKEENNNGEPLEDAPRILPSRTTTGTREKATIRCWRALVVKGIKCIPGIISVDSVRLRLTKDIMGEGGKSGRHLIVFGLGQKYL